MRFEIVHEEKLPDDFDIDKFSRRQIIRSASGLILYAAPIFAMPTNASSQVGSLAKVIGRVVTIQNLIALGEIISPVCQLINDLTEDSAKPVLGTVVDSDGDVEDQATKSVPIAAKTSVSVRVNLTPSSKGKKKFDLQTALNIASAHFQVELQG